MLESYVKRRKLENGTCNYNNSGVTKKYYSLNEACTNMSSTDNRVWACDREKEIGVGKFYVVKSSKRFYEYLCSGNTTLNWYEMILPNKPCNFYLGIEVGVLTPDPKLFRFMRKRREIIFPNKSAKFVTVLCKIYIGVSKLRFDDDACEMMLVIIKTEADAFVKNEEGDIAQGVYLESCRSKKFSIHYVNRSLTLDRNYISMKILYFALSRCFWCVIDQVMKNCCIKFKQNDGCIKDLQHDCMLKAVFHLSMLEKQYNKGGWFRMHNTVIDEGTYDNRRLFRLPCNAKTRSNVYLKVVEEGLLTKRMVSNSVTTSIDALCALKNHGVEMFETMLVSRVNENVSLSYTLCKNFPYDTQVTGRFIDEGFSRLKDFCIINDENVKMDDRPQDVMIVSKSVKKINKS